MMIRQDRGDLRSEKDRPIAQTCQNAPVSETPAEQWIAALRGHAGYEAQQHFHDRLTTYLFVVARKTLEFRRRKVPKLRSIDHGELSGLAEDFVQRFALKLVTNNYELLDKYAGRGRFLAWAAQIMRNLIIEELRLRAWHQVEDSAELPLIASKTQDAPESSAIWGQFNELVAQAVEEMSARNRTIFTRYILEDATAESVAEELAMSANAVYIAVHRIRTALGTMLTQAGYSPASTHIY